MKKTLKNISETLVRFSEVDSMRVVWHGSYVKYLEDGREAFGKEFGLGYMDVYAQNLMTPIVNLDIDYKNYVKYEDKLRIETEFIDTPAAKIVFKYTIYRSSDNQVVLKAKSTQIFTDINGELLLTNPAFYENWKKQNGLR